MDTTNDVPNDAPRNTADAADHAMQLADAATEATQNGQGGSVAVWRVTPNGRELLGQIPADGYDLFSIGTKYGPGRYIARLRVGALWTKQAQVLVGADAPRPNMPSAAPMAAPVAPASPDLVGVLTALIQSQAASAAAAQENMARMFAALVAQPKDSLSVRDLMPLLEKRSGVGEILETMEALRQLTPETTRDEGDSDLSALLAPLAAIIAANNAQPLPVASAPATLAPVAPSKPERSAFDWLFRALRASVRRNETPAQGAERLFLSARKNNATRALVTTLKLPNALIVAAVGKEAPEFASGMFRAYAGQVLVALRDLIKTHQKPTPAAPLRSVEPAPAVEVTAPEPEGDDDEGDDAEGDDAEGDDAEGDDDEGDDAEGDDAEGEGRQ